MKIKLAGLVLTAIAVLSSTSVPAQTKVRNYPAPIIGTFYTNDLRDTVDPGVDISRDRERPTPISGTSIRESLRDTVDTGGDIYYLSLNVEPGTVNATLNYTSPPGVTSMSVFFSGPDCCPPESELGVGETVGSESTSRSSFVVRNRQTLLIEVHISTESGRDVPFTLSFTGSVGGPGGSTICTDLSVNVVTYKVERIGTKHVKVTITGILRNESTGDFVSGEGQQSIRIQESRVGSIGLSTIYTQPFTTVRGGGRGGLIFATTKEYTTADFLRFTPSFKVSILYDSSLATDENQRNNDCVSTNNLADLAYRRP